MRLFLILTQAFCLAAVVAGVTVIYWPAGLITFGLLGAAVIERQT